MAALQRADTASVQADRLGAAEALARETGAIVILKGAATVVASPAGELFLSPFQEPALAVGGSGDVLSGCLAALLAQSVPALRAGWLGVYWHGLCGRILGRERPARGNLAREIADALPRAAKEILDAHRQ